MRTILTALLCSACGPEIDVVQGDIAYGAVEVILLRSTNSPTNPFDNAASLSIRLEYGECLRAFYDENEEFRQDGTIGSPIFADWVSESRLCQQEPRLGCQCNVGAIEQSFDGVPSISVAFDVLNCPDSEGLKVGPLPMGESVGCHTAEEMAEVILASGEDVSGYDSVGRELWYVERYSPMSAIVDFEVPIRIECIAQE